jgi:hypothetical protein
MHVHQVLVRLKLIYIVVRAATLRDGVWIVTGFIGSHILSSTIQLSLSGPPQSYNSQLNISEQLCNHCNHCNRSSGIPCQHYPGNCQLKTEDSQSHVTTDGQSVSKSWIRAPCGSRDQTLILVWHLLFYRCCAPLWQEVGSVICHSHYPSVVSKYIQIYM